MLGISLQSVRPLARFNAVWRRFPFLFCSGRWPFLKLKAHWPPLLGLASALFVALVVFGMPAGKGAAGHAVGRAYGLFPIGWIILNVIFLYMLADEKGYFRILRESLPA